MSMCVKTKTLTKARSRAVGMGIHSGPLKSLIIFVTGTPTSLFIYYKNDLLTPSLDGH